MKKYVIICRRGKRDTMPSTVTHSYFALDVYDRLPIKRKEFLMHHKERMKQAGQSADVFFFYNLTNLKSGKKIRDFGHYFHGHSSFLFFETLINYIKYNGYKNNPEVMAQLYGLICHYVLDSTCHPFIIYHSGQYRKDDPSTLKYNQKHGEMEMLIDNYFIQERNKIKPWKFDVTSFCFQLSPLSSELKEVLDFTYKEVFGIPNISSYYETALKQMRFCFRVFRQDFWGIKRVGYEALDFICPKKYLKKNVVSYHFKVRNKEELLNLNHKKWYYPTTKRKSSTESFLDLYLRALFEAIRIIREVDRYIYTKQKVNLKKVIGNKSYVTGIDCDKENELKYFAF